MGASRIGGVRRGFFKINLTWKPKTRLLVLATPEWVSIDDPERQAGVYEDWSLE